MEAVKERLSKFIDHQHEKMSAITDRLDDAMTLQDTIRRHEAGEKIPQDELNFLRQVRATSYNKPLKQMISEFLHQFGIR